MFVSKNTSYSSQIIGNVMNWACRQGCYRADCSLRGCCEACRYVGMYNVQTHVVCSSEMVFSMKQEGFPLLITSSILETIHSWIQN